MEIKKRANKVLRKAESELRQLIAEAAQQGDYSSIEAVATLAIVLNEMTIDRQPHSRNSPATATSKLAQKPISKTTKQTTTRRKARRKGKLRAYPKFAKSGDTLVKIAWSKSQKSEYKHKSPRSVLSHLVGSLDQLLSKSVVISMDVVLPIKGEDGNDIPDYQAYLCLAWLRTIGAVEQKGREGYTMNGAGADLTTVVEEAWNDLPNDM